MHAPLERVSGAISGAPQFGNWFGVAFDGSYAEETDLAGAIRPTTADAEVAKLQESCQEKALPRQDGIELTITDSGFDRLPAARHASAYAANEGGWVHQTRLLEIYLAMHA